VASAALWAGYILLGKRLAVRGEGLDSLAVGMAIGAAVLATATVIGATVLL
jgi:inner membrane transporter RhtA